MAACEPVGLDFIDRAQGLARAEVTLKASPADVWRVLNETEQWPAWFDGMKFARVTSSSWDGLGSTRQVKVGPLTVDEQMVAWKEERQWGFFATAVSGTGPTVKRLLEVVDIEPVGTGSKLTYTGAFDLVPWLRPLRSVVKKQFASAWQTNLAAIDRHIA